MKMKTDAELHQEAEINRTGSLVREARSTHEECEAKLSNNKSKILQYRQTISDNKMELDILGDPEKLNSELQKKVIDLKDSTKNYEKFITGAEGEIATLNHASTMAQSRLNNAQNNYTDARAMNQDSDGITSNERAKLKGMSMVKMSHADKEYWAGRVGGISKLREIVPMV